MDHDLYYNEIDYDGNYLIDEYNSDTIYNKQEQNCTLYNNLISSYTILKPSDVNKIRQHIIEDFMEFSCLSKEEATIALIHFKWNIDSIKSVWYDDVEENMIKAGLESSGKIQNVSENICGICAISQLDDTSFALKCGHKFCHECWEMYIQYKMEDLLTCIASKCPQIGCNITVPESVFYNFLPIQMKGEYTRALYKNFTDYNSDIKWCPTPDCGICILVPGHGMIEVECECKGNFCFKCGNEGHRPCDCEMIHKWSMKNQSESENVKWLIANTKQCPQCHKYIEKNQGCNHMTCRKEAGGCGYEFCWICLGEWKPHGSSYYQCTKFDKEKEVSREEFAKNTKLELEKYVYYFERYMNHQKSQELGRTKLKLQIQTQSEFFRNVKLIPYEELKFLEEAVDTIVHARRTLKNTYVFGYYMIKCNEKALFDHNQFLLDSHTDKLHGMMEGEVIQKILDTDNHEEFTKTFICFRNNVINLMSAIKNYKENLLSEIENKMMNLVDYRALNSK